MNNGIPQLKELVFRYCNHGGSSRGMREFIKVRLTKFAEENPHVNMQTLNQNGRHPFVKGTYICGTEKVFDARNCSDLEIIKSAYRLRNMSGRKNKRFVKPVYTWRPSIQGYWDADTPYSVQIVNDSLEEAEEASS